MILTLQRRAEQPHSTPGQLAVDGVFECFTLEPPSQGVAFPRIAAGRYPVSLRPSPKFQAFALQDAWFKPYCDAMPHIDYKPDSVTMIHVGNAPSQTHDCVLIGQTRDVDEIGNSRPAFAALYQKIAPSVASIDGCWIEILDCPSDHDNVQQATEEA